jgi:hypothetical protein
MPGCTGKPVCNVLRHQRARLLPRVRPLGRVPLVAEWLPSHSCCRAGIYFATLKKVTYPVVTLATQYTYLSSISR